MQLELSLFKVTKIQVPEWGKTEVIFEKYFLGLTRESVEAVIKERWGWKGNLEHYYSYDRCEERIRIELLDVEVV